MKKRFLFIVGMVCFIALVGYHINKSYKKQNVTDLLVYNIEALASTETYESYREYGFKCDNCKREYIGCLHCSEGDNKCSCTATTHVCPSR